MNQSTSNIDAMIENTDLTQMLEFETQIFLDVIHNDCLLVSAKGLNLTHVITNFLKVYCDPGNLVLVLNASEVEEKYFKDCLNDTNVHSITATSASVSEREDVYLSGGIIFVSTRILVVDMLKKRLPIEKITGIVFLRAHTLFESCQEALILRLYRQNNKTGFIKGFTNNPHSFTVGFGQVERVMRTLFVKELFIWPRFHSLVIQSLKLHQPTLVELHIPIDESVKRMQSVILDLMNLTVKEIKKLNKTVELQEITVENCLTKNFHKILQAQLDVIWHQLSKKSMQLLDDLKTLRHIMMAMFYSDSVTFYTTLMKYRSAEYAQTANWVLLPPAEYLFSQATGFIYNKNKEFEPKLCPKWKILFELLRNEIPGRIKKLNQNEDNTILILCSDYRTCYQLKEVLIKSPQGYLLMKAAKQKICFQKISNNFSNFEMPEQNDQEDECEEFQASYVLTVSQMTTSEDLNCTFEPFTQMENMNLSQICENIKEPKVVIQTFKPTSEFVNLQHCLESIKPNYVIMYHCSMTAVREIELYEAHRIKLNPLYVYFLIHGNTVEEQAYLTNLKWEKDCMEFLIETKSKMVVMENQDWKNEEIQDVQSIEKSTRQGKVEPAKKQFVIVDMREFRSDLPALLHKRGIDIEPLTITVGDYILTPEICVERKSLSDLIGSLNSGRLFQQCTQMFRFYSKPMLLIEFDQNKPFELNDNFMVSSDTNKFDVQQKLLLLTLHFPKLKIIWSQSAYASAELFEELKEGRDNPDVALATAIGEKDLDIIETKYNSACYDFVQKLPGISSKNIDTFLRSMPNMNEVLRKSETELKEILGNATDAATLYSALHVEHKPKEDEDPRKKGGKGRGRPFRKK